MTSGAIQKGVPTNVFLFIWVSVSWPATPKSASFTSPCSDRSTLAAEGDRHSQQVQLNAQQESVCSSIDRSQQIKFIPKDRDTMIQMQSRRKDSAVKL